MQRALHSPPEEVRVDSRPHSLSRGTCDAGGNERGVERAIQDQTGHKFTCGDAAKYISEMESLFPGECGGEGWPVIRKVVTVVTGR